MSRRHDARLMGLVVTMTLLLAACGGADETQAPEGDGVPSRVDTLTVALWGGVWGDAYQAAAIDRYEQETGVEVEVVTNVEDSLALLSTEVQRSAPLYDVMWLSDTEFRLAKQSGLLAEVNQSNIPGGEDLYDLGTDESGISSELGVWGLAYNEELVEPPSSWSDLLDPEVAPLVGMVVPSAAGAQVHNLSILAVAAGGTPEDAGTLGIETAQTLAENGARFGEFAEITTLFANGEVGLAAFFHQEPIYFALDGLPANFVIPEEGAYPVGAWMTLPANLPDERRAAAEEFMGYIVSPPAQEEIAEAIFSAPVNRTVELNPEVAEVVHPYGQDEVDSLVQVDWDFVLANQEQWVERWSREVRT